MKVLVDTNVVLDVLLARQPFAGASAEVFGLIEQSDWTGCLCATTLITVDYLLGRSLPSSASKKALKHLLEIFEVAPVTRSVLEEALDSRITDFEDAVLEQSARLAGVDVIVTRNAKDFRKSTVPALTPEDLLSGLRS